MITYFKYTQGSAFESEPGSEYKGMINVINNRAYTGARLNDDSQLLISKNTFISDVYLKQLHYNYNNKTNRIDKYIEKVKIYPRSILTEDLLTQTLDTLDENNLKLYSAGIRYNSNYFNKAHRLRSDLPVTHSLSAAGGSLTPRRDVVNRLLLSPERDNLGTVTYPNVVKSAIFTTENSKFKYSNLDDSITGSIDQLEYIKFGPGINSTASNKTYTNLYYNTHDKLMYHVDVAESKFDIFRYYPNLPDNSMKLVNTVNLSNSNQPIIGPGKAAFGRNYRTCLTLDRGYFLLEVYDVNSSTLLRDFSLREIEDLDSIEFIAQRFEDDALAILGIKNGESYIITYDIPELLVGGSPKYIGTFNRDIDPTYIEFSPFDSDVLFIKEYNFLRNTAWLNQIQLVSISEPRTPISTFSQKNIPYTGELFIINELDCSIDQCNEVILNNALNSFLLDIQFSVDGSNMDTILITNTGIQTDNYPLTTGVSPLNLDRVYTKYMQTNSSIGLILNNILRTLITDLANLYTFYSEKFDVTELGEIFAISPTINNEINIADFSVYGNESINSRTINRVVNTINDLQLKLARKI